MDVGPWELDQPQFVLTGLKKTTVSTIATNGENRSSKAQTSSVETEFFLQGAKYGRAFGYVIDQATRLLSAANPSDGATISDFSARTDSGDL